MFSIVGQVMDNSVSFFNIKKFAEDRWNSLELLESGRRPFYFQILVRGDGTIHSGTLPHYPLKTKCFSSGLWVWNEPIQKRSLTRFQSTVLFTSPIILWIIYCVVYFPCIRNMDLGRLMLQRRSGIILLTVAYVCECLANVAFWSNLLWMLVLDWIVNCTPPIFCGGQVLYDWFNVTSFVNVPFCLVDENFT